MRPTLCFVLVVALIGCGDVEESAAPEAPWQAPADADEVDWARAHYLGAEACAACHEKRWHEFSRTGHFNTLRLPDDDIDLLALADAPSVLLTRNPDLQFVMTRDATGVHQRAELVGADGVIERVSARVDLIMGSGKIFEGYLHWEGDALFQLPVGKMSGVEGFSNCPGYRDGEARFDRAILPRCLECHATWVESRPGEGGNHYDPDSLILGISCERCHGPGSEHVAWHEAQPRDPIGRRIVRPSELDRERRLDICAQCHGDPGVLLGQAFSFRPGTDLADHVEQTSEAGARGFVHTANQIQKLRDSACFQGSDKLECLTCHSPHRQERERLSDKARQACLRCHEREACGEQAELIASVRDDCAACHMPRHQVIDTTFSTADADHLDLVRMTDHRIGIYPAATLRRKLHALSSDAPELREMTAQLVTAIRQQAEADQAHGRWIPALAAWREIERLTGRSDALLTKIAACLEGQAAHERSEARYELAAAASARGAPDEAIALLEDSVAGNPHHAGSWHALAVLRSERGPPDRALAALDGAVEAGAGTAEIFALRGALRLQAGQLEGAESDLRKALEQG
ncbi:MAG: tetratricopeptide repeat protein, partial [Planctomycetes bacterium]|nr:tetratricopeptide repeat protein [Planctomycetota bacterium]